MNEALRSLIGQWVLVVSEGGWETEGRLESVDESWLVLRDKKGNRLLVYIPNICAVDERG